MNPLLGNVDLETLRQRRSIKWSRHGPEVLPCFVAEMDFDIAREIKSAVVDVVQAGDCGYPGTDGPGPEFADWAQATYRWQPKTHHVIAVPDVMTGIAEVVLAKTSPGAGVVINPPVYPPFFFRTNLLGRHVVECPLGSVTGGGYDLDLDRLAATLADPSVEAYLLCNPHNPLGRVWSRAQLTAVADICLEHDVTLVVDEIHAPLAFAGVDYVPFASLDHEMVSRAFTFTSASKGWNLAGFKCGLAVVGSDESAALLEERWEALVPSHIGVFATKAAYAHARPWLSAVREQLSLNAAHLGRLLAEELPTVGYVMPEASFLVWLDCRELGLGEDPAAGFLERGGVALSPGPDFGSAGHGYARLNIGTSPELITQAVRRMAASV